VSYYWHFREEYGRKKQKRVRNTFLLSIKKEMHKLVAFLGGMMKLESAKTSSMSKDRH